MIRLEDILDRVGKHHPGDNLELVRRAYIFSAKEHKGQVRASGEPYLTHPLEVANLLAEMKMDAVTVSVGLLHDVVEDTLTTPEKIEELFGPEVAHIVDGVTKISQIQFTSKEEKQAENFRKMLLAMTDDIRVIMVKFADRLHNMRTLGYLTADRREAIARETMEIYAPLANRLGMGKMRGELEDLAFSYIDAKAYQELKELVDKKRRTHEAFLAEITKIVEEKLKESDIPCFTESRIKRLYSIYQKLKKQRITIDQVFDLLALRIITESVKDCYAALGVIHNIWMPVPGRIKDFIAMPRPNMYQSLHTSVIAGGQPFEVQIRTAEMHRIAEEGIAAHWKYKDGKLIADDREDRRISWLRHLVELQQDMKDPADFLSTLKIDLYPEEVYTFTPKGKVLTLPRGATPVDFAYSIHTDVGHQCLGAKVNGQMVPLRHPLSNGDVVEIATQKGHGPSRDWLSFVRTSRARSKIRQWINLNERKQAKEVGRRLIEREARQAGLSLKKISEEELLRVASAYGHPKVEDLYAAVGYGKYSARQVLAQLTGQSMEEKPQGETPDATKIVTSVKRMLGIRDPSILVLGHDNLMVYRAKCCNPIPGDPIVGYVTRGRGVAVHNTSCPNVQKLLYQSERRINVQWSDAGQETYPVTLVVHGKDRPGLLADITSVISGVGANIQVLDSRPDNLQARVEATVDITDRNQLERILKSMKRISGVFGIERVYQV